jgi:3-hydroxyacyl-CoA dehydrogenase
VKQPIDYEQIDQVAVITLNQPPVNAQSYALRCGLRDAVDRAAADAAVQAIVITGHGKVFCGGADIMEFSTGEFVSEPHLPWLCEHIEGVSKLLITALNGAALGGGLEVAIIGDYRIALPGVQLGLPEVTLGLTPGAGGTQRLPRRIEPRQAMEAIVSGKLFNAQQAVEIGLVDRVIDADQDLRQAAVAYARELLQQQAPLRRCPDLNPTGAALTPDWLQEFRASIARKSKGFLAPEQCIRAVEAAVTLPLKEGLALEWRLFNECLNSPQHRAQRHLFFAERAARKIPGLGPDVKPRDVQRVGIVGSGTMGGGIAMAFLAAGLEVTLLDVSQEALDRGIARMKDNYAESVKRKRMTQEQVDRQLALLKGSVSYDDLAQVDLVIEAVFEDFALKESVFKELDRICKSGCILASNTSTLDLDRLAAVTSRPADVIGLHFFSPAHIMRLLEVVRGKVTAVDVLATALQLGRRIRKLPIVVGVCYGFVANRMIEPYRREAMRLLLEGATPRQVDEALTDFGMAMGPLAVLDLVGVDVAFQVRDARRDAIAHDPSYGRVEDEIFRLGHYGRKNGRGYFIYEGREQKDDPEVVSLAQRLAGELGIKRRSDISATEILERCVFSMIDEGARILEEGIAYRAGDCDLIYTNGFGFPVWRGGPMHFAGEIGLDRILERLNHYRQVLGAYGEMWFQPSALLQSLAPTGRTFNDYDSDLGK